MRKVIGSRRVACLPEVVQGFRELLAVYSPSCLVADAQERGGVMDSRLMALNPMTRFVGPALTVRLQPGNQVDCLDALALAVPGDVIVVDAAGETQTAVWGGLMSGLCVAKGVAGAVVDGSIRDTDEIRDLAFPIVSRGVTPRSTHSPYSGRTDPIEMNVDISCAGQVVRAGDLVLADEVGVVVVPAEVAADVLRAAAEQAEREEKTRARIRQGSTVEELLGEFGRL